MGRAATAIELDAAVRSVLERRAGSLTLPYRVVVRAKLVLLAADSHTNREIAARVDMSADRVADWRSQTSVCASAPSDHKQRQIPNNKSGVCLEKITVPAPARE